MTDSRHRDEPLEQLTAYLDGELSEPERAEVERLIASDSHAARLLDELRRTSQSVRSLGRIAAPADLSVHIAERLEREALLGDADARRPLRWMRPLSLAAGFVLVVTAGWLLWPELAPRTASNAPISLVQAPRDVEKNIAAPAPTAEGKLAFEDRESPAGRGGTGFASESARPMGSEAVKKWRSDEVPLALAPPTAGRQQAARDETRAEMAVNAGDDATKLKALESRFAGAALQLATTTSAPTTSAPTTTSAPATSQPTTRSAP